MTAMTKRQRIREQVLMRDNYRCRYCRWKADTEAERASLTLDHVIPKSKGGAFDKHNLVAACRKCNTKKGNRYTPPKIKPATEEQEWFT